MVNIPSIITLQLSISYQILPQCKGRAHVYLKKFKNRQVKWFKQKTYPASNMTNMKLACGKFIRSYKTYLN